MKTLANPADATEIYNRLSALTPADARRWGSMTVPEMVCHVSDAYEAALGRRVVLGVARRPPIPLGLYKWLAFRFPREWPQGVPTMPEINPQEAGTRPAEFATDLALLLERFREFTRSSGPFPPHPIFRTMSDWEWKRWGYLHADHHLRQFGR